MLTNFLSIRSYSPEVRSFGTLITSTKVFVTRSMKRGHFAQEFKKELLVLKGRVALKQ